MNTIRRTIWRWRPAGPALFLICILFRPSAAGDDPMNGPWNWSDPNAAHSPEATESLENPGAFLVRAYQDYVSPIDGRGCPMYPSCSQYGLRSFQKHGFFVGWMLTWDRLYRCGRDELKHSPFTFVEGTRKCYDPVEDNDFWWHDK